jgi:DNA-binding transcriptional LysR family regulator
MFIQVAKLESFSKAAKATGVSKSNLSKKVADLERDLKTTLLIRTTRTLSLTEAGKQFYERCVGAYSEIGFAQVNAESSSSEAVGHLRVTAPAELAQGPFVEIFKGFLSTFPKVTLELVLTDRALDMYRDNIDVAIRAGNLQDSNLKARKVGLSRFRLVASPSYLKKNPKILQPEDIRAHNCLLFTSLDDPHVWNLKSGSKKAKILVQGTYMANSINSLRSMAIAGFGLALLPLPSSLPDLKDGLLEIVLPDWTSGEAPIHFIYQNSPFTPPKVTEFLNFMEKPVKELLK